MNRRANTVRAFVLAALVALGSVVSAIAVQPAVADPATSGWRDGFCRQGEGLTVVVDFNGYSTTQEWDVRCRIGGTYPQSTSSRIAALEAVGHSVTVDHSGLVTEVDGIGSDSYSPWWKYASVEGANGWGDGTQPELPVGDLTDWFYGACLSEDGNCTPRIDTQFEPSATVTTTGATAATFGTPAKVTVRVRSGVGTPTGRVTLRGAGSPASKALVSGRATFTLSRTLAVGAHRLTASYDGGATFGSATSTALTVNVGRRTPSRPTLAISRKPTGTQRGIVRVAVGTPKGLPVATGRVRVTASNGVRSLHVATALAGGKRTLTLPAIGVGTWTIRATYLGDSHYLTATSAVRMVKVR